MGLEIIGSGPHIFFMTDCLQTHDYLFSGERAVSYPKRRLPQQKLFSKIDDLVGAREFWADVQEKFGKEEGW